MCYPPLVLAKLNFALPARLTRQAASLRNLRVRRLPRLPRASRGPGRGVPPRSLLTFNFELLTSSSSVFRPLDFSSLGLTLNLQSEVRRLSRPEIPTRSGLSTFNRVSFLSPHLSLSQRSSKSFTIRTSKTLLPQLLYNPHLQAPPGSAGNKGLITPLESALTRNSPVSPLESALTKRWGWGSANSDPLGKGRYRSAVIQTNRAVRARCGPRAAGIGTSRPGASPGARRYAWRSREGFCAAGRRLPPAIARGRTGPW